MSKVEVKVKKGDRWVTSSGMLFQVRGDMDQLVVNDAGYVYRTEDDDWEKITVSREMVPEEIARMWVEHFGGTVVEEREEEKAVKVVAHLLVITDEKDRMFGDIVLSEEGSATCSTRDAATEFRRIHIAGVTA
jgi:hypothetical protein